jgi:hypothetical protein
MGIKVQQAYFISPRVVLDGLVFYLDAANQTSYRLGSSTIQDVSGFGGYGTLGSGVSYSPNYGGTLYFDGTAAAYIDVVNSAASSISLGSVYTLDLWIKPVTLQSDFYWISAASSLNYNIDFGNGTSITSVVGGTTAGFSITTIVQPQTWINMILTRNGDTVSYYINSEYIGGGSTTWGSTPFNFGRIGPTAYWSSGAPIDPAYMSSVKIYNRILTSDEILQNFRAHKSRFGFL